MLLGDVIIRKYVAVFCLPRRKILDILGLSTFRPVCPNENENDPVCQFCDELDRFKKKKRINCMFEFWWPNKFHAWLLVSSCLSAWELRLNLSKLNKSSQLTCTKNPDRCIITACTSVPFWHFHFMWKKKKKIWQVSFYGWFLPGLFYCWPFLSRICFKNKTAFFLVTFHVVFYPRSLNFVRKHPGLA